MYNPLSYRLERQGFVFNDVLINVVEMLVIWVSSVALEGIFILLRIIFNPVHYFGEHMIDLEESFRYQVFIRGF